jgi:hypothetical protein
MKTPSDVPVAHRTDSVPFEAPITGPFSAPTDKLSTSPKPTTCAITKVGSNVIDGV